MIKCNKSPIKGYANKGDQMKDTDKKILLIGVILLIAAGAGQFAARTFAGFGTW